MPNWKKVVVSGSDAILNSVTAPDYGGNISGSATSTGSFGSFVVPGYVHGPARFGGQASFHGNLNGGSSGAQTRPVLLEVNNGNEVYLGIRQADHIYWSIGLEASNTTLRFRSGNVGSDVDRLTLDISGNAVFGGTIGSGAITSTGAISATTLTLTAASSTNFQGGTVTVGSLRTSNSGNASSGTVTNASNTGAGLSWGDNNTFYLNAGAVRQVTISNTAATFAGNVSGSSTSHLTMGQITSSGDVVAAGDVVAYYTSDIRLKDNIKVIKGSLDKIDGIRGVEFDWNEKSPGWAQERGHDVGVIAQEVQKVVPEIVVERKSGYLGVDYKRIIPLLIESVKELKQEVEDLKKKVN